MKKTAYNHLFDIERRMREIRTLHAMEKLSTKDAKMILKDLQVEFDQLLMNLPYEQREFFLRKRLEA